MKTITWRDDDPALQTRGQKFEQFVAFHENFQKYGVLHTIALITRNIEQNKPLVNYINQHRSEFDVQLHCVDHIDFTNSHDQVEWQLKTGADDIERVFGKRPAIWFPTWNKTDQFCNSIAKKLGLEPSWKKISVGQYIRVNGDVAEDVVNMHFWNYGDQINLGVALDIYKKRRSK